MDCVFHDCKNRLSKCGFCKHSGVLTELDMYDTIKKPNQVDRKGRSNYKNGIRAERVVANKFGGRVVPASGALAHVSAGLAGDVVFTDCNVLAQVKTRSKKGEDVITIQKEWIDSHWFKSATAGRTPVLIFSFYSKDKFWAISLCQETTTDTCAILTGGAKNITVRREQLSDMRHTLLWFKGDGVYYTIEPCERFLERCRNEPQN